MSIDEFSWMLFRVIKPLTTLNDHWACTSTGHLKAVLANRTIRCVYTVLANNLMCLPVFLCVYESLFMKGIWIRFETVNIAGIKMRLLVWRVGNKTLKFRLTFLILAAVTCGLLIIVNTGITIVSYFGNVTASLFASLFALNIRTNYC